jgi:hypothetical protein
VVNVNYGFLGLDLCQADLLGMVKEAAELTLLLDF